MRHHEAVIGPGLAVGYHKRDDPTDSTGSSSETTESTDSSSETSTDSSAETTASSTSSDSKTQTISDSTSETTSDSETTESTSEKTSESSSKTTPTSSLKLSHLTSSVTSSKTTSGSRLPTLLSKYTIPTVTVPPNSDNPYIYRTTQPSGTVFIAFAGIIGFALVVVFLVWLLSARANRRNTRKGYFDSNSPEKEFTSFLDERKLVHTNPFYSNNDPSALTLPFHTRNNSQLDLAPSVSGMLAKRHSASSADVLLGHLNPSVLSLSAVQSNDMDREARRSLFVSPTAELLLKRRSVGLDGLTAEHTAEGTSDSLAMDASLSEDQSEISAPAKADVSALMLNVNSTRRGRTVPSMYLDELFDKDRRIE